MGDTHVSYSGKIHVACQKNAGGCSGFAKVLVDDFDFDVATTCADDGADGCDCNVTQTIDAVTDTPYSQDGSIIAFSGGGGFEICEKGNTLDQHFGFSHRLSFVKQ
ncbi:MAG TPA: hypothetical protein VM925_02425 [Labilithrix sp.]|nr:hypothetical protein [Labilithrix sp.]